MERTCIRIGCRGTMRETSRATDRDGDVTISLRCPDCGRKSSEVHGATLKPQEMVFRFASRDEEHGDDGPSQFVVEKRGEIDSWELDSVVANLGCAFRSMRDTIRDEGNLGDPMLCGEDSEHLYFQWPGSAHCGAFWRVSEWLVEHGEDLSRDTLPVAPWVREAAAESVVAFFAGLKAWAERPRVDIEALLAEGRPVAGGGLYFDRALAPDEVAALREHLAPELDLVTGGNLQPDRSSAPRSAFSFTARLQETER